MKNNNYDIDTQKKVWILKWLILIN
jgi:hypothetical protein